MKRLLLSLLAVTSVFMTGCASIMNGKTHHLEVISEPPGATVSIKATNGSYSQTVTTPTTLDLPRNGGYWNRNNYVLEFSKEGYESQVAELNARVSKWYSVGNIFFGGPLGWFAIDPTSGSMYVYDKKTVDAKLTSTGGAATTSISYAPAAPAPAPVATVAPAPVAAQPTEPAVKPRAPIPAATPVYVAPVASPAEAPAKVDTSNLKLGTWSYDVEQMAKAAGCQGEGAWLISKPGMKEAYRVFCKDGKPFTAVCDSTSCSKG